MLERSRFLIAAALLAGLTACGDDNPGETRVVVIDEEPQLVDAARVNPDAGDTALMDAIAQGLVRFDARGQVIPGLAERWHVSDDGRSYIFRLGSATWPDGEAIRARDVATSLKRLAQAPRHPLAGALQGIEDVVAMTDRVIEIRLSRPQPGLLSVLAQPSLGITSRGQGSGPFMLGENENEDEEAGYHLSRLLVDRLRDETSEEIVHLNGLDAARAIESFGAGEVDLVLGGDFTTLPLAQNAELPANALRFDPVLGLFGLIPLRETDILGDPQYRGLLNRAIDREALVNDLSVPGLTPRATLLQDGLIGNAEIEAPAWLDLPITERQGNIAVTLRQFIAPDDDESTAIASLTIYAPEGPGGDILFNRLAADWGRIGIEVQRSETMGGADLALVDAVAPSLGLDWFLNRFRCGRAAICNEEIELLFEQADAAPTPAQRQAILLQIGEAMDRADLFMPLTAPIRWSLVSPDVTGFAPNALGRHPLIDLKQTLAESAP